MLDRVTVANLGLIEAAEIILGPGLTVVSGETGTGKTVVLGALRLLRGDTASKDVIGPHDTATDVSGLFVLDGEDVVIRRTVDESRSRAYIDGRLGTARELTDRIARHVSIVGQHDQHLITNTAGVRRLVDLRLDQVGDTAKSAYHDAWGRRRDLLDEAERIGGDPRVLQRELETLRDQVAEIDRAGFEAGEGDDLTTTVGRLRSAAELTADLDIALKALTDDEFSDRLSDTIHALERARRIDDTLVERLDQAIDVGSLVQDLVADLQRYVSDLGDDAERLDDVERRLAELGALRRKYGDSIEDILSFRKDAASQIDRLMDLIGRADALETDLHVAEEEVLRTGAALRTARVAAARRLADDARTHLVSLGFSDPVLDVVVVERTPGPNGCESVEIRFASDAGLAPGPVSSVASGGELSRLVLALTVAAGGVDTDVVAFDEIDAGIGGATALAVGEKLAAIAAGRQVICVTHLPQVAAYGDHHLVVSREGTTTRVVPVDGDARVAEITRMLAGLGDSAAGQRHAEELLARVRTA